MKTQFQKLWSLKSALLLITLVVFGLTSAIAQTDTTRKPASPTSPYPKTEPMNPNQTSPPVRTQPNQTTPPDQTVPNQNNPNQQMNMKDTSKYRTNPNTSNPNMNNSNMNSSKLTPDQIKKIVGNDQKVGVDAQGNQLYKDSSGRIYYIDANGQKVYKK